jgi:hypothetical protein
MEQDLTASPAEIWKPIPGLEGRYDVSDLGRIRNTRTGLLRKLAVGNSGYQQFLARNENGKYRQYYVHRCVLLAFDPIDNPHQMEGNHKDFDRLNNKLSNLEWLSRVDNLKYSRERGRCINGDKRKSVFMRDFAKTDRYGLNRMTPEQKEVRNRNWKQNYKKERHGSFGKFGELMHTAKLTEPEVIEIHRLRALGLWQTTIARLFNVGKTTVQAILSGRSWPHIYAKLHECKAA